VSPIINISIEVPEGVSIAINGVDVSASIEPARNPVEEYWADFLSDNGRKLYAAAARTERRQESGYSFEDLAKDLGVSYETAKSYHRNSGRTATRWKREKGSLAPIRLAPNGSYQRRQDRWLMLYTLPPKVAEEMAEQGLDLG
jgi:hypothetical protein